MKTHPALIELKEMEKTLDNTKSFIKKHLPVVAFHFSSTYGFPIELFEEEMKVNNMSLLEQLLMIKNFYETQS